MHPSAPGKRYKKGKICTLKIRVSEKMRADLQVLADQNGLSLSELIRTFSADYIAHNEWVARLHGRWE